MNVRDSHVRKMAFLIVAGALRVIKAMKKKISEVLEILDCRLKHNTFQKSCHPLNICTMSKDTPPGHTK